MMVWIESIHYSPIHPSRLTLQQDRYLFLAQTQAIYLNKSYRKDTEHLFKRYATVFMSRKGLRWKESSLVGSLVLSFSLMEQDH